jgi:hypothetical protein
MNRFPDFDQELRRGFDVDERCLDCVELYHGCSAQPENPDSRCADYFPLPDVGVNGETGQKIPPSKMGGRKEPRIRGSGTVPTQVQEKPESSPAGQHDKPAKLKVRTCGCGVRLPRGKRLCDGCRIGGRRQTKRQYMRTYMRQRRSGVIGSDSGMPFPAQGTHVARAGGEDRPLTGHPIGVPRCEQTSVLTGGVPQISGFLR